MLQEMEITVEENDGLRVNVSAVLDRDLRHASPSNGGRKRGMHMNMESEQ